ncbi:MAG: penicillin-binding protein, partial [Verrucomicrobiaceae bacterium]
FRVAGKTGTVCKYKPKDKHSPGGYMKDRYIVSFAGMMPAQDPAFVCIVVIDDPRTTKVGHGGGTVAAPTFQKIATRVASHLNLKPTEPVKPDTSNPLATAHR